MLEARVPPQLITLGYAVGPPADAPAVPADSSGPTPCFVYGYARPHTRRARFLDTGGAARLEPGGAGVSAARAPVAVPPGLMRCPRAPPSSPEAPRSGPDHADLGGIPDRFFFFSPERPPPENAEARPARPAWPVRPTVELLRLHAAGSFPQLDEGADREAVRPLLARRPPQSRRPFPPSRSARSRGARGG